MKLLYIARVFSGLESSLRSGRWAPTGVPTIYKMIEALDKSRHEVRFLFCEPSGRGETAELPRGKGEHRIDGLDSPVKVLCRGAGKVPIPRVGDKLSAIARLRGIGREIERFDPDLVYVDRSNVLAGALAARRYRKPVLLRVMGIYPSMWEILKGRSAAAALQRWAFRSPFAFAVCTQDGTGGEAWMNAALLPQVARRMMLNGVDPVEKEISTDLAALAGLPGDKLIVLFVGRLEDIKGWREFTEGVLAAKPQTRSRIHALMIGTGADKAERDAMIAASGAASLFTCIDRLPHRDMQAAHNRAQVYVSLNKLGNLSNANLECYRSGLCTVMPESDRATGADVDTDRLIPAAAAIRLPRARMASALGEVLDRLAARPDEIAARSKAMAEASRRFLVPWDRRIADEMRLLEGLAAGHDPRSLAA
ncbi:MAG: glycosyltransferase [Hyphomicrobiales bacterium]